MTIAKQESSTYVFDTNLAAEAAIRSLGKSGFDMQKLSLVGKGDRDDDRGHDDGGDHGGKGHGKGHDKHDKHGDD